MLEKFVNDICNILSIEVPKISYDTSGFKSSTMMAQYDSDGVIYLRKKDNFNFDFLYSVAHELRHAWQLKINVNYFFSNYKTVDFIGAEKYNNQIAEIDAHAFACLAMNHYFCSEPLFNGVSPLTISLIKKRKEEIKNIFNIICFNYLYKFLQLYM